MIDQTIPIPQLLAGMARTVREWILPHLEDAMARTQAELLATLLDGLSASIAPEAAASIRRDSEAARQLLGRLGKTVPAETATPADDRTVDERMRENSALKARLEELATRLHGVAHAGKDAETARAQLLELQRFFAQSLAGELGTGGGEGTDFKSMTAKEGAARRD